MKNKLKVAAYARVSTDKDDQANSLTSQRQYFTDLINKNEDWELQNVYYDEGISGTQTKKREGFNKMIDDAMHHKIDLILTKEVSRFARNTVDTLSYTRDLKEIGVGVIFTIDNIDTRNSEGEFLLTIMASIAQEESRKTSERVKWGQKRRMEQGVVFGRDMLGYSVKNGKLSIIPEEVPVIKAIFHKYTNEGKGTWTIARELTDEGMRPKNIAIWSNVIILRILKNEKYVGDLCQKKTITPNYLTHSKKYNHGEEQMIYLKDHHEPIIDRDLWDRTQAEIKRRSPSAEQKSKYSNRYWCSGKILCGECHKNFVSRKRNLKSGVYKAWRCFSSANQGGSKTNAEGISIGCNNNSVNEKTLLKCMEYCIHLIQKNNKDLKKEILCEIKKLQNTEKNTDSSTTIQNKINAIETKKRKVIDAMLDGLITEADFKKQNEWYDNELAELNQQLMDALNDDNIKSKQMNDMQTYIQTIDEIMSFNTTNTTLYREVLNYIEVHRGNILDVWLNCLPFGIRLKFQTSGRLDKFRVEILETSFLEK